jgi:hypothetical protein
MYAQALGLCSAFLLAAAAPADPAVPDRARVLQAIEVMFAATIDSKIGEERRLIASFADESDEVAITIASRFTGFLQEDAPQAFKTDLLGFYIAGAVKFDLEHPAQREDELADVAPALEAVLRRYAQIRAETEKYRSPFLDRFAAQLARGKLREYIQALPRGEDAGASATPETPGR